MKDACINIAISGLGLTTTEELKIQFRQLLPKQIGINWINIADQNLDCLIINEIFFENNNIQKIIALKEIPYLKISKGISHSENIEDNTLYLPMTEKDAFQKWINQTFIRKIESQLSLNQEDYVQYNVKDLSFFTHALKQEHGKVLVSDQFGTLAIIDNRAHLAWLEPTRQEFQTDRSIKFELATTSDFMKVSRKKTFNLENCLFNLIWNAPQLISTPTSSEYYRLHFWPQLLSTERKSILQLSACFIQGAEIAQVAAKLELPIETVQHFIAANLAIQNAELISAKDSRFGQKPPTTDPEASDHSIVKSFFGKLKRRFGF